MSDLDDLRKEVRQLRGTGRITPYIAPAATTLASLATTLNTLIEQLKDAKVVQK